MDLNADDFFLLNGEDELLLLAKESLLGILFMGDDDAAAEDGDGLECFAAAVTTASLLCLHPMMTHDDDDYERMILCGCVDVAEANEKCVFVAVQETFYSWSIHNQKYLLPTWFTTI